MTRETRRRNSNNLVNPNQNVCAQEVAKRLGVEDEIRYLHTLPDLVRAARKRWQVRSRFSSLPKGATVGKAREKAEQFGARYYIACVDGHVLLLNRLGETIIDTAPRKRDRRKVKFFYGVWNNGHGRSQKRNEEESRDRLKENKQALIKKIMERIRGSYTADNGLITYLSGGMEKLSVDHLGSLGLLINMATKNESQHIYEEKNNG